MTAPTYSFRDARLRSPLLRSVNAIGSGLGSLGFKLPSLAPRDIVSAAQKKAASGREPEVDSREALGHFATAAEDEAELNTLGRGAVHNMLVGALASQFAVLDWHDQHPEIGEQAIRQPWVVVGLPRTGTSILSILLGLDPYNRPLLQWEARQPIPPSTMADASEDPRIAALSREFARLRKLNPAISTMHPFGSTLAEECTAVFTYALRTIGMETIAFVPGYGRWLASADMTPAYRIHRKTLQALQSTQPTGHWVLKSPNHLWSLPALMAAYPDARVIWTHRDPAQVIPSLASLNCAMQIQFTRHLDPVEVGNYWADKVDQAIDRATAFDRSQDATWCYHAQYKDLLLDPVGTLRRIYSHFGAPLKDLHRQRIETWLCQKPQHADGQHVYRAEDFGWTGSYLEDRFGNYRSSYVS